MPAISFRLPTIQLPSLVRWRAPGNMQLDATSAPHVNNFQAEFGVQAPSTGIQALGVAHAQTTNALVAANVAAPGAGAQNAQAQGAQNTPNNGGANAQSAPPGRNDPSNDALKAELQQMRQQMQQMQHMLQRQQQPSCQFPEAATPASVPVNPNAMQRSYRAPSAVTPASQNSPPPPPVDASKMNQSATASPVTYLREIPVVPADHVVKPIVSEPTPQVVAEQPPVQLDYPRSPPTETSAPKQATDEKPDSSLLSGLKNLFKRRS